MIAFTDYATDKCGHIIGPENGAYIEFDRTAKIKKNKITIPDEFKGKVFDCTVILKGLPSINGEKKYISIFWRKMVVNDPNINKIGSKKKDCGRSYAKVFQGTGVPEGRTFFLCGKDAWKKDLEWLGQTITIELHVDYRNTSEDASSPDGYIYPEVYFKLDFTSFDYGEYRTDKNDLNVYNTILNNL